MKKQLIAQKEYIEVALKDTNDLGNTNAANAVDKATNQNAKIEISEQIYISINKKFRDLIHQHQKLEL